MDDFIRMVNKITKEKLAEIKDKIAEFEYVKNGLHRLNGTSVEIKNLRIRKDKAIVDIILIFEDRTENYPDEEYDLKLLEARGK